MPVDAFRVMEGNLRILLGGAEIRFFNREEQEVSPPNESDKVFIHSVEIGNAHYFFEAKRPLLEFTEIEKSFCREMLSAFQLLFTRFSPKGSSAHFRTALLTSLMDITVSRYLRSDRQKAFWPIQKLIQVLKDLTYQRYEGEQPTTGFIVYRKTLSDFRNSLAEPALDIVSFDPRLRLTTDFFRNPISFRYIDGYASVFLSNIQMKIPGILRIDSFRRGSMVDRLSYRKIVELLQMAGDGTFATFVNKSSEIEIITRPNEIILWRKGLWALFSIEIFCRFMRDDLQVSSADLAWAVYSLSKIRHGTIILITDHIHELESIEKSSLAGESQISKAILAELRGRTISELKDSGDLIRALSSDGLTIFNSRGELVNTGVIIDTSNIRELVTGGGRTAAACAASDLGKVIKVSQDGPIELYQNQKCVYRFC